MTFRALVSRTFQRFFESLDESTRERIREGLEALEEDPYRARPGADIKQLSNTDPPKHRLRIGPWRVVYRVEDEAQTVKVIEGFRRGRG